MKNRRWGAMSNKAKLLARINGIEYKTDVPAREYTSFRIGGPMAVFSETHSVDELKTLISAANECNYPAYILGNGSNMLIPDEGVDALFVRIASGMSEYSFSGNTVVAGAGALLCSVAKASVKLGLSGLEWAAGIPGTIGGAIAMNAGAYGGEMKQVLTSLTFIQDGAVISKSVEDSDLAYRYCAYAYPKSIIVSATLQLSPSDGCAQRRMEEYNRQRKLKQPLEYPSAGSVFKRPAAGFAGKYIEDAGLKGRKIGNAMVSEKHAGFIINLGGATYRDVVSLIDEIKECVFIKFGVMLTPEIRIL